MHREAGGRIARVSCARRHTPCATGPQHSRLSRNSTFSNAAAQQFHCGSQAEEPFLVTMSSKVLLPAVVAWTLYPKPW